MPTETNTHTSCLIMARGVEIQSLLLSSILPRDIVIGEIYRHLYLTRTSELKELKTSIVNEHFYLTKVLLYYYKDSLYSKNSQDPNYFLYWVENDMLNNMNDHIPLASGLSQSLKEEFPNVTTIFLMKPIAVDELPNRIYELWSLTTHEKRRHMYSIAKAGFYLYID